MFGCTCQNRKKTLLLFPSSTIERLVRQLACDTYISGRDSGEVQKQIGGEAGSEDDCRFTSRGQSRPASIGALFALMCPVAVLDLNIFKALENGVKSMLV